MIHWTATVPFFLSLGLAVDISLQAYDGANCGGNVISNVHSNPGDSVFSSGCVATNQFQSVSIVSADPGFKCNVFSDSACSNFIQSFESTGCTNVVGTGVICFNQATFDNPFALSTAEVTLGKSKILSSTTDKGDYKALIVKAVAAACGENGCDPNTKTEDTFRTTNNNKCNHGFDCEIDECAQTVTISGNYDNANQRDYMSALLQVTIPPTAEVKQLQTDHTLSEVTSFAQVVINDHNKNNQAQMSVSIEVACSAIEKQGGGCTDLEKDLIGGFLGEVPEVGGVLATGFNVACDLL